MVVADQHSLIPSPLEPEEDANKKAAIPTIEENEPALPPPFIDSNPPPTHMDTLLNEGAPAVPLPTAAYSPFAVVPEHISEAELPPKESSVAETSSIDHFPPFRVVPPADLKSSLESLDEKEDMAEEDPVLPRPTEDAGQTEPETMPSEFATVADAVESITPHGPEAFSEQSENEESPKRVLKPARPQKRARTSSSRPETDEPQQPKAIAKKRRTLPLEGESSFAVSPTTTALVEMTLQDLPDGWRRPLVYFVTEQQHENWGRAWKQLPDRKVSTGAVYLSRESSGTPDVPNHAEGPTAILRDLCALVQEPNDEQFLHERSYVSLSRASVRETINFNSKSGPAVFEFGVTKLIKASNEREYIQPVPLDVVCEMLVAQLRAMLQHSQRFPSHLFALDLHVWQYAPTVCLHTRMAGLRSGLMNLLEAFASEAGQRNIMDLTKIFQVRIAAARSGAGSRRRNDRTVGTNLTYVMDDEEKKVVEELCNDVDAQLKKLRVNWVPKMDPTVAPPQSYKAGEVILKDFPVLCIPRSSAALRDRVSRRLGAEPLQIPFVESMIDETSGANFQLLVTHLLREDNKWLNNFQHALFLDFTLSEAQEEWIMSHERMFEDQTCPATDSSLGLIQAAIRNAGMVTDTGSSAASNVDSIGVLDPTTNTKLVVSVPETKIAQDVCNIHKVTVSLVATQDISDTDTLKLGRRWSAVTWSDLVADEPVPEGFTVPTIDS